MVGVRPVSIAPRMSPFIVTGKYISNNTQYFSIVCFVFFSKLAQRGAGIAQSIAQLASDKLHVGYIPLPCRFEKICPKNKVSIVQLILQLVVVCINGLNVTFRARWFHRVFPAERRDCDCPGFPPPLGSRRLRSRNCLHLTSIPLSFNKPASGRRYQIIFIATRRRMLVIDGKGRVHL